MYYIYVRGVHTHYTHRNTSLRQQGSGCPDNQDTHGSAGLGLFPILNSLVYPKLIVRTLEILPGTCSRMKLLITHSHEI